MNLHSYKTIIAYLGDNDAASQLTKQKIANDLTDLVRFLTRKGKVFLVYFMS